MWLFFCSHRRAGTPELGQGNTASSAFLPLVHLNTVNRELSPQDQAEKLRPREGILLLPITPLSLHPATRLPAHLRETPNPCLRALSQHCYLAPEWVAQETAGTSRSSAAAAKRASRLREVADLSHLAQRARVRAGPEPGPYPCPQVSFSALSQALSERS